MLPKYLLSIAASIFFVMGGVFMKHADGLKAPLPTFLFLCAFAVGAALQSYALRYGDLGVVYVLVLGLEAVLAAILGWQLFGETISVQKLLGVTLIVAGIIFLDTNE
ncbi:MAG: DMT family transporter [Methylobacter sp.]